DEDKVRRRAHHVIDGRAAARIRIKDAGPGTDGRVVADPVGQSETRCVVILVRSYGRIWQQRGSASREEADTRYEVIRPSSQKLAQNAETEVRQPAAIGRLIFPAQAKVQCETVADSPVILHIPIELFSQRVFGYSAVIAEATHASDCRGWKSKQKISARIAGV